MTDTEARAMDFRRLDHEIELAEAKLKESRTQHDSLTRERDRRRNAQYVGRCFVYQNCGGAGDNRGTWPLYIRVVELDDDAELWGVKCQMIPHWEGGPGAFQFERDRLHLFSDAREISAAEYAMRVSELLEAARDQALA